ncbi:MULTISPECIES: carbohydrate kinase [Okeania]|uniref:Carbohydrate kinase n=1 Tax=Okeania hirsuta TaxID=1458930 RepID=A0A3N6RPE9_9CYAN|nr:MULTISPECIES: carbohydrate kinase [Okeania]NET17602.1 carbohydrate kinase [Okeania sp. SIO1H6]NES78827.1 carbohydrate kinase [Okeania sp. SIO1H4]NET22337.1 carbohydrate kinase [Okeania sp. SIO1H5]NET95646.1 carbohydrate kinase [Okeania sp. SIO1H2]RQH42279.1 carbohydrate kinase [Okeania hirsuta]
MTHLHVLCLGEILFDCLADRPGIPLNQVQSWTIYPGGALANVACGLVKLGTPSALISAVGQDTEGKTLVKFLQEVGVDTTGIQQNSDAPTRKVYVLHSTTGEREFVGFGDRQTTEFADTHLQAELLPESLFLNGDFLILGTLGLAYPETRQAIYQALELADQYHLKIMVDVNWRPSFWPNPDEAKELIYSLLKRVDFVKLSIEEAKWLFESTEPAAITYQLNSVEGTLITAGDLGCAYYLSENEGKVPAFSIDVVDTTGAGDSFVAGFVHQLRQYGIRQLQQPGVAKKIVTYASAVGALSATKKGAMSAQPTVDEVEAFFSSYLGH